MTTIAGMALTLCLLLLCSAQTLAQGTSGFDKPVRARAGVQKNLTPAADTTLASAPVVYERSAVLDASGDTVKFTPSDSLILAQATFAPDTAAATNLGRLRVFNPNPTRAMWLS
ncbi:MAG: hypothetical protein Q4B68_03140, partial [Bacteroidales bacterium]|nr:hypothetical protein [Bacteroidales bacterium]